MVTATDPSNDTRTIDVAISITNVNESPRITGGPTRVSKMEVTSADDAAAITLKKAIATYRGVDPESAGTDGVCTATTCAWSLGGDDAGDFKISNVGALTFKANPNYESPADANEDNTYMVNVMVTDGANTAMRSVTITVSNLEEDRLG